MTSKEARRRAEEQAAWATSEGGSPGPVAPTPVDQEAALARLEEGGPLYARYRVVLDFVVRLDPPTEAQVEVERAGVAAEFPGEGFTPAEWHIQQVLRAMLRDQAAALPVLAREIAAVLSEDSGIDWPSRLGADDEVEDAIARLPIPDETRDWLMLHRRHTSPDGTPIDSQWYHGGSERISVALADASITSYSPWHRHDEQEEAASDGD